MVCGNQILLNSSDFPQRIFPPVNVNQPLTDRTDQLEMLYTDHERSLQALNEVVSRQDREILALKAEVKRLQQQLRLLGEASGVDIDPVLEAPPHY